MTAWKDWLALLEHHEVTIEPGLSAAEVRAIEADYAFRFPPDLRDFLMTGLPISHTCYSRDRTQSSETPFINWRRWSHEEILTHMAWPLDGICFAIEHANFWLDAWGERPADLPLAFERARQAVAAAPRLIPLFGWHRFFPATPHEPGNPVFSVSQTDIIYYGRTLAEYLDTEFMSQAYRFPSTYAELVKYIPFWSDLAG